jgi:radical SAM protein with 4Fe4S-binding SPASM domain
MMEGKSTVHSDRTAGPLFVWNISSKCNLRCVHCYSSSEASPEGRELTDDKCVQLVDEISALKPPIVLLSGGEPLMRKNVFDIIRACKSKGLRVGLSTNGTLIDKDMAEKIAASGVDYAGVSIDGREELHDGLRGSKGSSASSWKAIERLNSLGVKTGIRFTLTDNNKEDLFYVLEKALLSGAKRFCLYHLVYTGRADASMDMAIPEKRKLMKKFFGAVREIASGGHDFEVLTTDSPADGPYMISHVLNGESFRHCEKDAVKLSSDEAISKTGLLRQPVSMQQLPRNDNALMGPHGGCSAGERIIYLDSTGDVYPCQFLRDESLGNVTRSSLSDIWGGRGGNALLAALRAKHEYLEGRCARCAHKKKCAGCRARAKSLYGSLWAEDPACYLEESDITDAVMCAA